MTDKNLLLIFRSPPFSSSKNRDNLDIALACSAFDIPLSLVFIGEAVLQLKSGFQSDLLSQKDLSNTLNALPMYDITDIYVLEQDLVRYNLTSEQLLVPCQLINASDFTHLQRDAAKIISL